MERWTELSWTMVLNFTLRNMRTSLPCVTYHKLTTSSPEQREGMAESAVKIAKKLLQKVKIDHRDVHQTWSQHTYQE